MVGRLLRRYTTAGFRQSLRQLLREYGTLRRHRRGLKRAAKYRDRTGLKVHLGCGSNVKEGWVNVDLADQADLSLDLREPLPFPDGSCALVYSEHFLEHVDYPEMVDRLLKECLRILQPGGLFRVGVPDAEWPLLEYAGARDEGYFEWAKAHWHPKWCATKLEQINYHFRQDGEHRFAYDYPTLEQALTRNGFVHVERRAYDPAFDLASRQRGTLYAEGVKPVSPESAPGRNGP
jgi:predicted SAM-dependent methyltransferase